MRRADAAVAVCEAARAHFVSQGIFAGGHRTEVVPNGIELGEPAEIPVSGAPKPGTDRLALRSALGCGADELVIGTVGRLAAVKNHSGLLDAVAAVRRSGRPVRLVLAGDGACRESLELQAMAPDLAGAVHFLGWRSDVSHVMRAIDVFALSSSAEGWPLVLVEAAAAGTPCVATAVGGVPEMVSAGSLGLLVPAGDSQAMASALISLLDAPGRRAAIGSAARRWAQAHGSVDAMGHRYEALYASLVARRSSRSHPVRGAS
jgi:glycosyltransferase involved in cell wall biosynthesis